MPKTVQFSDAAYATLRALRREGESFSDALLRLASERKDPRALRDLGLDPAWDFEGARAKMAAADRATLAGLFPQLAGKTRRPRRRGRTRP